MTKSKGDEDCGIDPIGCIFGMAMLAGMIVAGSFIVRVSWEIIKDTWS